MHRNYQGDNLLQGRFRFIQSQRTLRFYISNSSSFSLPPHEVSQSFENLRICRLGQIRARDSQNTQELMTDTQKRDRKPETNNGTYT